ncbi:low temperature essential protein [Grosmannia clavigera kw1407]|uniref:Low temperature essential protein n=1 Tax=Grosmannia clavigera (strain kw1407 / UAMH 11150) TaxID=655863 RepID=F0X7J5_GROCL|nr:low temperature essential protein [Grosmannia clavigera kw1407]EFX06400.1 low temperature essential protein [Grosmannia clavigera kw1407]
MEATFELPIMFPADRDMDEPDSIAMPRARPQQGDHSAASHAGSPRESFENTAPKVRKQGGRIPSIAKSEATGLARSKGSLRDAKNKRASDRHAPRPGARLRTRIASNNSTPKSLLPVTERRSQEENKADRRATTDGGDSDIAPDGSSAGRECRQFIVSNVGNNGRIYLRPTVRPAHLRFPQPSFVFPMTPPSTAGLDVLVPDTDRRDEQQQQQQQWAQYPPQLSPLDDSSFLYGSDYTPDEFSPTTARKNHLGNPPAASRRSLGRAGSGHRRAISDSTVRDASIAHESDPGGFKIVITQPADMARAKTVEDLEQKDPSALIEIAIPTWKLGTPRFTPRGTPMLRGSSYASTEEVRSSRRSYQAIGHLPLRTEDMSPRRLNFADGRIGEISYSLPTSPRMRLHSRPESVPVLESHQSNYFDIDPSMFDALTFKPACDDRSVVRFSPATGSIAAATPPRLVAEITSPKFMDYDLVSDFFLTYRAFLDPNDLLRMLVARLRWAVNRDDEVGTVVRVRTFVALRHWILNYFMDDFVIDYELRLLFCRLINTLVDDLAQGDSACKVPLKILAELKKCWRRSCAQYWDGAEFDDSVGSDVPISPGGIAGHRNPALDPSFWGQAMAGDIYLDDPNGEGYAADYGPSETMDEPEMYDDFGAGSKRTGHIDSMILGDRPATPENQTRSTGVAARRGASSPLSVTSLDFVSCSFPTKNLRLVQAGMGLPPAAHPVDPSLTYSSAGPVATTPRALMGKRVRPSQSTNSPHKRSTSQTDSFRELTAASEKSMLKDTDFLMTLPYAGSLVRGAVFPPGQPYVEVLSPSTYGMPARQTTVLQRESLEPLDAQKQKASAMSGQGMRRLLGGVRRALSTRGQPISSTNGNYINISPIGPRGATINRLPGTAIVPQARPRCNGVRSPVRIDLLGAKIAEDFRMALRENASAGTSKQDDDSVLNLPIQMLPEEKPSSPTPAATYSGSILPGFDGQGRDNYRPTRDTGITTGSKSILIFDDTLALDFPVMTGALPASGLTLEAFGADPTPPTTPPGQAVGTPRRSSYILGSRALHPRPRTEPLPPFVPDMDTLGGLSRSSVQGDDVMIPSSDLIDYLTGDAAFGHQPAGSVTSIPSVTSVQSVVSLDIGDEDSHEAEDKEADTFNTALSPVARVPPRWTRGHARQISSRSYVSSQSFGRQRFASLSGDKAARSTLLSFDATTYSEASIAESTETTGPRPLRVLRRRPGGDLRAVKNVGDLDTGLLRRSRSVGSLTAYTDSIRSSHMRSQAPDSANFIGVASQDFAHAPRDQPDRFSVGMLTEKKPKRQVSMFSTHSSKPMMRPSFEAEAQKLAQIPDEAEEDVGVEAALLKLEGRFEPKSLRLSIDLSPADESRLRRAVAPPLSGLMAPPAVAQETQMAYQMRHADVSDLDSEYATTEGRKSAAASPPPEVRPAVVPRRAEDLHSFLSESGESYSSVPLLDRGLTDDGRSRRAVTDEWGNRSVFDADDSSSTPTPTAAGGEPTGSRSYNASSYEMVCKTISLEKMRAGDTMPGSPSQRTELSSFLDDESDGASDLSSEMSADLDREDEVDMYGQVRQRLGRSDTVVSRLPAHALGDPELEPVRASQTDMRDGATRSRPPSPPMTLVQALRMSPQTAYASEMPEMPEQRPWSKKRPATAPDTAILRGFKSASHSSHQSQGPDLGLLEGGAISQSKAGGPSTETGRKLSVHLPFILAFESEMLAQQLTLIEKDALHEIDWKELIEMRWKDAENSNARSWVEFLRSTDARGVEVVIARFNIMVKWAISEVVLTQNEEERARCLIKFIHIAEHCRRYRNFATMSQITMALTSNEVNRLSRTWSLVPKRDESTLRDLEALVSPTRNFYSLRAEMEAVGIDNADAGCIPFVGIYTHDLLFNAQRPSEIAGSPTTAPLVNFERCRMAAGTVKTLLRLVEASALYSFQPIEGVTERCLWMSALSDEAIRKHSEALE